MYDVSQMYNVFVKKNKIKVAHFKFVRAIL